MHLSPITDKVCGLLSGERMRLRLSVRSVEGSRVPQISIGAFTLRTSQLKQDRLSNGAARAKRRVGTLKSCQGREK